MARQSRGRALNESTPGKSLKSYMTRWFAVDLLRIPGQLYDATVAKIGTTLTGLVKRVGLMLSASGEAAADRDFQSPEWDLQQIENAYEKDGYVRTAIDKYVDLIFKAGYDIVGKNPNATEYIKARLAYIAEVSGTPTEILFNEIAQDLVMFHNVIVAKARSNDNNAFPPGGSVKGMDGMDPVAAYFPLNMTTIQVKRDKNGAVKQWQQTVGDNTTVKFKPTDIVHMYYKREKGRAFAYPSLLAVIDDVRALREVEERTLHMLYRNIHPLFHVKVGSKETPGQPEEVDAIKAEVQDMSVEGGLVSTERVEIKDVASNKVIDADKYLTYFEKRVFTGLGVSETMMGRGDTANRNTGDNQKEEATDRVKAIQKVLSTFITFGMINELLREGGFDPLNNPDDQVVFAFKDPDSDSKIKQEAHAIFLYQNNAITEDEMRMMLGKDPIADGDRALLWFPQYGKSADATNGGSAGNGQADNTVRPANQSGKKTSPKKTTNGFKIQVDTYMHDLRDSLMKNVGSLYIAVPDQRANTVNTVKDTQRLVVYWKTVVEKTVVSYYGEEQANSISKGINQVFENIYNTTIDIMSELNTQNETEETIAAVFDVFMEEFKILVESLREEEITSAKVK